jgi:hypothetical protein
MNDDRELWTLDSGTATVRCWMMTCCGGAELQVIEDGRIVLRELYPMKSDLYERARAIEAEYRTRNSAAAADENRD